MRVTQDVFIDGKTERRLESDHNFSILPVLTPSRQLFANSLFYPVGGDTNRGDCRGRCLHRPLVIMKYKIPPCYLKITCYFQFSDTL